MQARNQALSPMALVKHQLGCLTQRGAHHNCWKPQEITHCCGHPWLWQESFSSIFWSGDHDLAFEDEGESCSAELLSTKCCLVKLKQQPSPSLVTFFPIILLTTMTLVILLFFSVSNVAQPNTQSNSKHCLIMVFLAASCLVPLAEIDNMKQFAACIACFQHFQ